MKWWMILILSVLLSWFLWGKGIKSNWWIIDDHEIVHLLGSDMRVGVRELKQMYMDSEVGHLGKLARYRPTYWALRLGELWLWQGNSHGWYIDRLLLFAFCVFGMWLVFSKWVGQTIAVVLVMVMFTQRYWIDIVLRLGPSEIYAAFFLTLALVMFQLSITKRRLSTLMAMMGYVALVLSVGSKENLIFVLILLPWVLIIRGKYDKLRLVDLVGTTLLVMVAGLIYWAVSVGTRQTGTDIYAQSTSLLDRVSMVLNWWRLILTNNAVYMLMGILSGGLYCFFKKINLFFVVIWIGTVIAWVSAQVLFYNGVWPTGMRYDFPGLYWMVLFTLGLCWVIGKSRFENLLLVVIVVIFFVNWNFVRDFQLASEMNVKRTNNFIEKLQLVKSKLGQDDRVVLLSGGLSDLEPLHSTKIFLSYLGVENNSYVYRINRDNQNIRNTWEEYLDREIEALVSSEEFIFDGSCLLFSLDVISAPKWCNNVVQITQANMNYLLVNP